MNSLSIGHVRRWRRLAGRFALLLALLAALSAQDSKPIGVNSGNTDLVGDSDPSCTPCVENPGSDPLPIWNM